MNKNFFLLLVCFGISVALSGCRHRQEVVEIEEKRVSGPLSDCDIEWTEADYK